MMARESEIGAARGADLTGDMFDMRPVLEKWTEECDACAEAS